MEVEGNRFLLFAVGSFMYLPYLPRDTYISAIPLHYLACVRSLNRFNQNKTSQLGTKVAKATGFS